MKKLFVTLLSLFLVMNVSAQGLKYRGFSGGMMLHAGYVNSFDTNDLFDGYSSIAKGIGGAARVHLGKHLRVGGEGYVSTANYDKNESYVSLGWGGVLADYAIETEKYTFYAGATFGGGSVQHLQRRLPLENDFIDDAGTNYRHYATTLLAPFVGLEYALNERIHLTAKLDYYYPLSKDVKALCDFPAGPRCYIGFLFYHL